MEDRPSASIEFQVTTDDTARALLSGELEVLATPRLVAWLEAATCAATHDTLAHGQTTVGTGIVVDHVAASPVGACVIVSAVLSRSEGHRLAFDVEAKDRESGELLGGGVISRAVVDSETFMARLATRHAPGV
ncbi:thioesterase [Nocardioides panacihumi]|uniref:Thioesterase n=1 Tax=Nocardioides panacihumi TaxID=400774 RepID=A0ABP5CWC0_9ACTN